MKNSIEYKLPRKKQRVYGVVKGVMRLFIKKPKVVSLTGEVADKSLILANHCAKIGPFAYDMYFPHYNVKWGAHQMLGNYSSRKAYLRDVFYIAKKGFGKKRASFLAGFEAIFSKYFYRGIKVVGTYEDARLRGTIKKSIDILNADIPIMIFPENSWNGYLDVLTEFFGGFVILAEQYYKKTGIDLPIYPVYYHQKKKIMLIGEPDYVYKYQSQGLGRKEIAEIFKNKVNELYYMIEEDKIPQRN